MMSPIAVPVWRPGPAQTRSGAAGLPRLLPESFSGRPATLAEHLARHGTLPSGAGDDRRRQALIREVERSGLRGRGGAGFPTAVKVRALAAAGRSPLVIANGTEGEPASAKDKTLLACAPHLVLDGAVYAAGLIGARQVVVVVHHAVRDIVARAADERRRSRYDGVPVRVLDAATGFVAGEASAVVRWVERGIALPSGKPPRLGGASRAGLPVLVQNVETLAHLALIARRGAAWFRSAGTAEEPGSMLVTMAGAVRRPGVYEVEIGTRVGEMMQLAGGASSPLSALLIGGYFGTWAGAAAAAPLPFSAAGLAAVGAGPGAGLVAALPETACGLAETARLARYLAAESAGQCGPCVFGLNAVAGEMARLATGRPAGLDRIRRWLGQVSGRGACRHPDGAARMIGSALAVFGAEADQHARRRFGAARTDSMLLIPPEVQP
jgi:NADH:ubiquinone oxidoreductase subunit F (NADH-binding)